MKVKEERLGHSGMAWRVEGHMERYVRRCAGWQCQGNMRGCYTCQKIQTWPLESLFRPFSHWALSHKDVERSSGRYGFYLGQSNDSCLRGIRLALLSWTVAPGYPTFWM